MIPQPLMFAIKRYVFKGILPGHFLTEVIKNNLFGAVGRADEESMKALKEIIVFLYNRTPGVCWGSEDKMRKWIALSELEREKITRNFKKDFADYEKRNSTDL